MKTSKRNGNALKKTMLAAALIIGTSTMVFQGMTQAAAATVCNKTDSIPTRYANNLNLAAQLTVPEGYTKANYTVDSIDLPYYANKVPTKKDLTKKEAAELAAQYLWQIYGVNLEGQTIEMGYDTVTENTPRPTWTADVNMKNQTFHNGYRADGYEVEIDSVTGEMLGIDMNRTLQAKVKAGPDYSIDESKYEAAAKKIAEKYNIVHSDIQSMSCTGQGASFSSNAVGTYGDPDISFEVQGKNGEVALMTISRYDQVLAGIMFNGQYQYDKERAANLKEKIAIAEQQKSSSKVSSDSTKSSALSLIAEN